MKRKPRKKVTIGLSSVAAKRISLAAHSAVCSWGFPHGDVPPSLLNKTITISLKGADAHALAKQSGKKFVPKKRKEK